VLQKPTRIIQSQKQSRVLMRFSRSATHRQVSRHTGRHTGRYAYIARRTRTVGCTKVYIHLRRTQTGAHTNRHTHTHTSILIQSRIRYPGNKMYGRKKNVKDTILAAECIEIYYNK